MWKEEENPVDIFIFFLDHRSAASSITVIAMASELHNHQLHFILIPLMSPGHLIPMIDMATLLAGHGMVVTIVTTPLNANKFRTRIHRAAESGLRIHILQLQFPATEAGLPEGCENLDSLPSRDLIRNFFIAASRLRQPFEEAFETLQPRPSCIISGKNLPWTVDTARKYGIPRIFFDGMGCFAFTCAHKLQVSKIHERVSMSETFLVPDLPHPIELTPAKLPEFLSPRSTDLADVRNKIQAAEGVVDGIVVNTFEEMEAEYVEECKRVKGIEVWCIGPVSAGNKLSLEKADRGEQASIDEHECLKWLDQREPGSVVYACLGSTYGLKTYQLVELGLGLEASNKPFIWVIRGGGKSEGLEKWIAEEGFEKRTKGRGLVIHGWSPQLLILSNPAIGCFLTHCGWNSTMEGVSARVPIVACPLFAEQFFNEKLIVEVLKIGVSVGVEAAVTWGLEEKSGLVMKREQVKEAIDNVMDKGIEGEERRKRAKELGNMANRSIEEGGASYINMEMLIQFVRRATSNNSAS